MATERRSETCMGDGEDWVPVEGWPVYEVSNHGRVRKVVRSSSGSPGIFKPYRCGGRDNKYRGVTLCHRGTSRRVYMHHLVLEHFGPPKPSADHQCNHIDGDKSNNRVENLEWVTPAENMAHAAATGLLSPVSVRGVHHPNAKLNPAAVLDVRRRAANGELLKEIAKAHGVTRGTICDVVYGRTWKHVPVEVTEAPGPWRVVEESE